MFASGSFRNLSLLVALLATGPAMAQRLSLADRVAKLEQESANQGTATGQANVELLNRLTQVQTEVQALRGQIEQLQNENGQLKQRAREQYVDLDTRLQRMEGAGAAPPAGGDTSVGNEGDAGNGRTALSGNAGFATATQRTDATGAFDPAGADGEAPVASAAEVQAAYDVAFNALRGGDYVASSRGFQAFLRDHPRAELAPNAWYWLGESYYATQNFPLALQSFERLLAQFPNSAKAPDALLKRGYCQIELGQVGPGQQTLNRVINEFPNSDAARLATTRLRTLDYVR